MKIIEHGLTIKPNNLRFDCSYCGCVFEATKDEFKMHEEKVGLKKKKWVSYVAKCPECGRDVSVYRGNYVGESMDR